MPEDAPRPAQAAIRTDLGAIFVSLELSRRTWLITSLSPGGGEKMSKPSVPAGEVSGLLRRPTLTSPPGTRRRSCNCAIGRLIIAAGAARRRAIGGTRTSSRT